MKLLFAFLLSQIFIFGIQGQPMPQVHFYKGSLLAFQTTARDNHIPSLLYIHGDENDARLVLYERRVLEDSDVALLIDSALMIYQVDATKDYNVPLQYAIEDLPVLILFDKNGWEISRLYGYHHPDEVVKFLKEIYE
jgi:hypothetical protein